MSENKHLEYIVWGIPPNHDYERPLYTLARNPEAANRAMLILQNEHDCTHLRIQELDMSVPPNFAEAINL